MKIIKEAKGNTHERDSQLIKSVMDIIENVRLNGDKAIIELSKKFDKIDLKKIKIDKEDIKSAYAQVDEKTIEYLKFAADQIKYFAEKQLECLKSLETSTKVEGVILGHKLIPVESCGAYIPAGRYPLPSTALMNIIPAKIAGVKNMSVCCPPSKEHETIHPVVLVAMDIAGADNIYVVGGAQAIASMAYGTETVKKVDLITGPGNRFVAEAKRQVLGDVGIDSIAGPSEVLIIADETANPEYIAIDLLAQSEHDLAAKSTLVTTYEPIVDQINKYLDKFIDELDTGEVANKAWEDNGSIIIADSIEEAIEISNNNAPEHLEVHTKNLDKVCEKLINYGSLFIGEYAPVAFGDYCSGTNHTLPTMKTAKYSNGLWVGTFIKTSFFQKITRKGCENLSEVCMNLAHLEGLLAHEKSVKVRLS